MPINPNIALLAQPANTAPAINDLAESTAQQNLQNYNIQRQQVLDAEQRKVQDAQLKSNALQDKVRMEQLIRAQYDNMNAREQRRITSTIAGAAQLSPYIEAAAKAKQSGDQYSYDQAVQGARDFLTRRKQALVDRMGGGENIDTTETDYALQQLESGNLGELQQGISGLMAAGQVYGVIKPPSQNPYIEQFNAVKRARPDWTDAQVQDYVYTRGRVGSSTIFDENGNVVNQPGAVDAAANMKFGEESGKAGGKAVIENEKSLGSLESMKFSIQQARDLLPSVSATGPILGRAGNAAADPAYRNFQGALNSITLQAKDLYNLGSGQGFTDADRDFLQEIIGGKYDRAETFAKALDRMDRALANRRDFLEKQNQKYQQKYGGQSPADVIDFNSLSE